MLVVVAYDVSTETAAGRRRLRRVARVCSSYGQRAQKSLFECNLGPKELVMMRGRLLEEIDQRADSLRLYFINDGDTGKIEQYGQSRMWDFDGPLVV
jgi:CRISPR-associated protein Cas2